MKCIEGTLSEKLDDISRSVGAESGLSRGCRYFTGNFPWVARYDMFRKRIMINQEFLSLLTGDEALAVLVHEVAHAAQRKRYFLRSIITIIFSATVITGITQAEFALLGLLYTSQLFLAILMLAITLADLFIILPLVVKWSICLFNLKRFEIEADLLAARVVGKEQLISALKKAHISNLHARSSIFRRLIERWLLSVDTCVHLPYDERLEFIQNYTY